MSETNTIHRMRSGIAGKRLRYADLLAGNGLASGSRA